MNIAQAHGWVAKFKFEYPSHSHTDRKPVVLWGSYDSEHPVGYVVTNRDGIMRAAESFDNFAGYAQVNSEELVYDVLNEGEGDDRRLFTIELITGRWFTAYYEAGESIHDGFILFDIDEGKVDEDGIERSSVIEVRADMIASITYKETVHVAELPSKEAAAG